ncbi:hypothetical protein M231_03676 [Tremella mesenterica]|uniref:Uncharacterized protein n=1 Tax=Tremella mesenterica TaxID=5217 RepID=A0A4Q1BN02_TREME|nr:hypothetical protein M231_03676 [Tremella mesenterica]
MERLKEEIITAQETVTAAEAAVKAIEKEKMKKYRRLKLSEMGDKLKDHQPTATSTRGVNVPNDTPSVIPITTKGTDPQNSVCPVVILKDGSYVVRYFNSSQSCLLELNREEQKVVVGDAGLDSSVMSDDINSHRQARIDFDNIWEQATADGPPKALECLTSAACQAAQRLDAAQSSIFDKVTRHQRELDQKNSQGEFITVKDIYAFQHSAAMVDAACEHYGILEDAFPKFLREAETSYLEATKTLEGLMDKDPDLLEATQQQEVNDYSTASKIYMAATGATLIQTRINVNDQVSFIRQTRKNLSKMRTHCDAVRHNPQDTAPWDPLEKVTFQPDPDLEQSLNNLKATLDELESAGGEANLDCDKLKQLTLSKLLQGLQESVPGAQSSPKKKKKKKK